VCITGVPDFRSNDIKGLEMLRRQHLSLGLLLCVLIGVTLPQPQCIYPICACSERSVICEARSLAKIPTMVLSNSYYDLVNFDMNDITDIPAGSLPQNLTNLMFTNNPITTIAETAFDDSAFTLDTIYLSYIAFTKFPDAFSHLKVLKHLSIEVANVQDWNEEAMTNLGQTLTTLVLDNVGMTSWPTWLRYFSHLTDITVVRCSFSSIPDDAFDNMASTLVNLYLFSNELVTVPKALSKLSALQILNFQENRIINVTWLPQTSKLKTLLLSNNLIADANLLSNAVRPFANSLVTFDINTNRLSSIPDFTFFKEFTSVDLTHNKLTDYTSGAFDPSIRFILFTHNFLPSIPRVLKTLQLVDELSLSYNSIRRISASDFPNNATTAVLGFNFITELSDNSFPINSTLTSLWLNNNPITTISSLAFNNLIHLTELYLQGTRLSRMPLALSSLTNLYVLNMADTATLVCTCQEKSLAAWVLTKTRSILPSNCGLTDIYHFFSDLSPACP
jgi:Leucine-rich repeat (LRR) protein